MSSSFRVMDCISDEGLIFLYQNGDLRVKNVMYERYKNFRWGIARSYFIRGFSCEDIESECAIKLLDAMDKFDLERGMSFKNFYFLIAKQHMSRLIRKVHGKYDVYESCLDDDECVNLTNFKSDEVSFYNNTEKYVLYKESINILSLALKELSLDDRGFIIACVLNHGNIKKISDELGISYSRVYRRKCEILKFLRNKFYKYV